MFLSLKTAYKHKSGGEMWLVLGQVKKGKAIPVTGREGP
jgi:hypothetical protein